VKSLTPKQQRFVAEYLIDLNATQAAVRAGYSEKTANEQGARLLANASVAEAVAKGKAGQLEKADISATRVLEEMRRLAFSDVRALFDDKGRLRRPHEWTAEAAASVAGFEVTDQRTLKVKVWDKSRNLEMLARHLALFKDKLELTGNMTVSDDQLADIRRQLDELAARHAGGDPSQT